LARVKKFGMFWIMALIMGILMFIGVMGTIALPTYILFGLLADLISHSGGYDSEYADALMKLMPGWILPVLLVCCFVFGILGGLLGRVLLKKHFVRAGTA
jgi:energy-coupling factor transport system substrate-specific component